MNTSLIGKVHKCHLSCLEGASGRSISRILSSAEAPGRSSICTVYPGLTETSSLSSLLDLAPDGGYLAARIAARAGGLLHHLFTIAALRQQSVSVARSGRFACEGFPVPGFPRHRALWSADFPRSQQVEPRPSDRPEAGFIIPVQPRRVNIPLTLCQRAAKMIIIVCYHPLQWCFSIKEL